jgi:hypothetical protein
LLAQAPTILVQNEAGLIATDTNYFVEVRLGRTDFTEFGALGGKLKAFIRGGVVTFDSLTLAGRVDSGYTIVFFGDTNYVAERESDPIFVTPGRPNAAKSSVTTSTPSVVVSDDPSNGPEALITVTLRDAQENLVPNEKVALLQGSETSVISPDTALSSNSPGSLGQASFTAQYTRAVAVVYSATADTGSRVVTLTEQAPVQYIPAPAAYMVFVSPPFANTITTRFDPAISVAIFDQFDNQVISNSTQVSLATVPATTTGGSSTVTEQNGLVTFTDFSINNPGTYTLVASASGLSDLNSISFDITGNVYPGGDGDGFDLGNGRNQNLDGKFVLTIAGTFEALAKLYDGTTNIPQVNIINNIFYHKINA